jgi:hypothetical protein
MDAQLRQAETQLLAAAQVAGREARRASATSTEHVNQATAEPKRQTPDESYLSTSKGKKYVLFEGTVLETLLINRLNGTFTGPVNCLVTTDLYSHDRQHVLVPAGSRVLGESKKVDAIGQQRLAVFFHRLVMPDGYSVTLDEFKGLNQIGETALRDKVNNHYLQIFGASLAIGTLGSHSSLNIFKGAKEEGFRTVCVCKERDAIMYKKYPLVDDFIMVKDFTDLLQQRLQEKLRKLNVVLIPHGSFTAYLSTEELTDSLMVPMLGNRQLLHWEANRKKQEE